MAISPEASQRICTHMNEDHAVSVYAMAKSLLSNRSNGSSDSITQARLKQVTAESCTIAAVTCSGDACEMHSLQYPFTPPLTSAAECRSRMVAIHRTVCSPRTMWLVQKPLAPLIWTAYALLAYGTLVLGSEQLSGTIQQYPTIAKIIKTCFGSVESFVAAFVFAFYFTVVAHGLEGVYTLYHARKSLKLPWGHTLHWFALVLLVGYPVFVEFQDLMQHISSQQGEKSH
jgi:hypothetical protein